MVVVNLHGAKTHLSRLIDKAIKGEPLVIAKAVNPLVKVEALEAPRGRHYIGWPAGQIGVPDDVDTIGADVIAILFSGGGPAASDRLA